MCRPRPCSVSAAGSRLTGGSGQGSVTMTATAPEPSRRMQFEAELPARPRASIALVTSSEVTVSASSV